MIRNRTMVRCVALGIILPLLALVALPHPVAAHPGAGKERKADDSPIPTDGPAAIERVGASAAKPAARRIPWLWIGVGVVAAAAVVYFLVSKKYTLTVNVGEGVTGTPAAGTNKYKRGEKVAYDYSMQAGYSSLDVKLDGEAVAASGVITMDRNHTLEASASTSPVKRVVVAEEFTGTWCGFCPGAAMGLEELKKEAGDSLAVIAYHYQDDFADTAIINARKSYYSVPGYPDVWFDGTVRQLGGSATMSMYSTYKPKYEARKNLTPPLTIRLLKVSSTGVDFEIRNVSGSSISGTLHVALVENNIAYAWKDQTVLNFVCRTMLPDANGVLVNLAAGKAQSASRSFTISGGWNRANCKIIIFVQGANKEIYQGLEIALQ